MLLAVLIAPTSFFNGICHQNTKRCAIRKKASTIRLLITDVDGVLTDSGVYYGNDGEAMKRFSIRDGMAVERLKDIAGVETAIMTGELSGSVVKRAEKLKVATVLLGVKDKQSAVLQLMKEKNVERKEVAFIGDDVNDLGIIAEVGLSACPSDAFVSVKKAVDVVCDAKGGHGAFREFAELILEHTRRK